MTHVKSSVARVQGSGRGEGNEPRASARTVRVRPGTASAVRGTDPFEPVSTTTQSGRCTMLGLPFVLALVLGGRALAATNYADEVISYAPGSNTLAIYRDPQTALGEPSRFNNAQGYPMVVSMFNGPYLGSQLTQIGGGGSLIVKFNQPILNDPAHPYGADVIVFGNSFFQDAAWPNAQMSDPAAFYSEGAGHIEVSADGIEFFEIPGALADGLFPTQGYIDAGAYDTAPGLVASDFRKPVNPALTLSSFNGLSFAEALSLYNGSGGGTPVDIGAAVDSLGNAVALSSISYVKISNMSTTPLEIDAFVAVPEPVTAGLMVPMLLALYRRRAERR